MFTIHTGDCREVMATMPAESVQCVVTSPPYWGLRDYGHDGQYGLEKTPEEYTARMVDVFREARRVLRDDGVFFLNLGDSYASGKGTCYNPGGGDSSLGKERKKQGAHPLDRGNKSTLAASGLKPKDLVGIPWRVAFALQADGWYLRQDIIWHKPNPMPESVTDRCTKSHEYIFLLTKSARYFYDAKAIAEPIAPASINRMKYSLNAMINPDPHDMRHGNSWKKCREGATMESAGFVHREGHNRRSVWTVATTPFSGAHFATFPPKLIEPCILAGCPRGGTVLDPFIGSGTTGLVCLKHDRNCIGIELNPVNVAMANERIAEAAARGVQEFFEDVI